MTWGNVKIRGLQKEFGILEEKLKPLGFDRWSWDYDKLMYDFLYEIDGRNFYLRIPGRVVNDKQLENRKAVVRLMNPICVEHFFPHGIKELDEIPSSLQNKIEKKLQEVEEALA